MDTWDWVAIAAAAAAIASAWWAGRQAKEAKRQAVAAEATASLMVRQIEQQEKHHQDDLRLRQEEREANRFWLDLKAYPTKDEDGDLWLDLRINNNSMKEAHVDKVRLVFGDGTTLETVSFVAPPGKDLPHSISSGQHCVVRFVDMRPDDNPSDGVVFIGVFAHKPDYRKNCWRKIDRIEVEANNQTFKLTGEDDPQQPPHWKAQLQMMPAA